jgi:hypothetical protein
LTLSRRAVFFGETDETEMDEESESEQEEE